MNFVPKWRGSEASRGVEILGPSPGGICETLTKTRAYLGQLTAGAGSGETGVLGIFKLLIAAIFYLT